jgi:hypothetical protein
LRIERNLTKVRFMTYILQRFSDNGDSTLGLLLKVLETKQGKKTVFQGYTLEDEQRAVKVSGETRIPAGIYTVDIQKVETPLTMKYRAKYPWFKNHLEVKNVPGFKGIYLHVGNYDENSDGCILIGDVASNNVIGDGSVSNSTIAFRRFYLSAYDNLPFTLVIRDEKNLLE